MQCPICKEGQTSPGKTTVFLQRENSSIIIKDAQRGADICSNCKEYYLDEDITEKVMMLAEEAANKGVEIEVLKFAA